MARFADLRICRVDVAAKAVTNYKIVANNGDIYFVFINLAQDVQFRKSTDGGITWQQDVVVFTGTAIYLSVWFDRWSSLSAGLIHCAYTESVTNDTLYRTINTESSDALSTQTVIFAGASQANGGHLTIARALGGNVYCKTCIDAGVEGGFFRLPNANVPNGAWDAARTIDEALATQDQMILMPGFAADNQDMLAIFWDGSANEISRKIYDDSANTWAETSIATGFTDLLATVATANFSAVCDLANSRVVLIAWNNVDTALADLQCWTVTESAITAKTDVVANGTDDQGLCTLGLDTVTGYWYAAYGGKSDGSETWNTAINIYGKVSTDSGATWGPEYFLSSGIFTPTSVLLGMHACMRFTKARDANPIVLCDNTGAGISARCATQIDQPSASHQMFGG